jgi:hypothetical protein
MSTSSDNTLSLYDATGILKDLMDSQEDVSKCPICLEAYGSGDTYVICRFPDFENTRGSKPNAHEGHTACKTCVDALDYVGEKGACVVCLSALGGMTRQSFKYAGVALRPAVKNAFGNSMLQCYEEAKRSIAEVQDSYDDQRIAEGAARRGAAVEQVKQKRLEREREAAAALEAEQKAAKEAFDASLRAQKEAADAALEAEKRAAEAALEAERVAAQEALHMKLDADKKAAQEKLRADMEAERVQLLQSPDRKAALLAAAAAEKAGGTKRGHPRLVIDDEEVKRRREEAAAKRRSTRDKIKEYDVLKDKLQRAEEAVGIVRELAIDFMTRLNGEAVAEEFATQADSTVSALLDESTCEGHVTDVE